LFVLGDPPPPLTILPVPFVIGGDVNVKL